MILFPAGTVVGTSIGVYEHVGIATGEGTVISASKRWGRVAEESPEAFSGGRRIYAKGFPGTLAPDAVVARARGLIGRRYDLVTNNCEHVVRHAHGLPRRSPQFRVFAVAGAVSLALLSTLAMSRRA